LYRHPRNLEIDVVRALVCNKDQVARNDAHRRLRWSADSDYSVDLPIYC
jgi:hypothetical protein